VGNTKSLEAYGIKIMTVVKLLLEFIQSDLI
jgi:hypothetical protein